MALAEEIEEGWTPEDTFGARLALIRQARGWNYKEAGTACDVSDENWRHWESGMEPRRYRDTCIKIATHSKCNFEWLFLGGPIFPSNLYDAGLGVIHIPGEQTLPFELDLRESFVDVDVVDHRQLVDA